MKAPTLPTVLSPPPGFLQTQRHRTKPNFSLLAPGRQITPERKWRWPSPQTGDGKSLCSLYPTGRNGFAYACRFSQVVTWVRPLARAMRAAVA